MKVDFFSRFQDIKRIIDAPKDASTGSIQRGDFGELLSDISPQASVKSNEIGRPAALNQRSPSDDRGPLAAFKFSEPGTKIPDIDRILDKPEVLGPVNGAPPGVKTPTILSVRRTNDNGIRQESGVSVGATPSRASASEEHVRRVAEVTKMVEAAGERHGVDPQLSLAVVSNESSFNPTAVSNDGHSSKGLFQLLDSTGTHLLNKTGVELPYDPFNPEMNVDLGVGYLKYLHEIFSKETSLPNKLKTVAAANSASLEKLAVAAFNAGEGRVASAQARAQKAGLDPAQYENVEKYLPESTQKYVSRVTHARAQFEPARIGSIE